MGGGGGGSKIEYFWGVWRNCEYIFFGGGQCKNGIFREFISIRFRALRYRMGIFFRGR